MIKKTKALYYANKGLRAYNRSNYKDAVKNLEKSVKLYPIDIVCCNLAIFLKEHFQEYEKAKQYYEKAIELNPNLSEAYGNLAILLKDHFQEYEKAKKYFEKAIKINPNYAIAYNNLATLLQEHYQEYGKAKKYYEKAIEVNPNDAKAYNNLGVLNAYYLDNKTEAKRYFSKAINLNPDFDTSEKELHKLVGKEKVYISEIDIKNINGLKNRQIKIEKNKSSHLFITGDNGYFKTSILEVIRDYMLSIINLEIDDIADKQIVKNLLLSKNDKLKLFFNNNNFTEQVNIKAMTNIANLKLKYETGQFIFAYLPAHRKLETKRVEFVGSVKLKKNTLPTIKLVKNYCHTW